MKFIFGGGEERNEEEVRGRKGTAPWVVTAKRNI